MIIIAQNKAQGSLAAESRSCFGDTFDHPPPAALPGRRRSVGPHPNTIEWKPQCVTKRQTKEQRERPGRRSGTRNVEHGRAPELNVHSEWERSDLGIPECSTFISVHIGNNCEYIIHSYFL